MVGFPYPYGETVTFINRTKTGVDSRGNDVFADTPVDVAGCPVYPRGASAEDDNNRNDIVITGLTVIAPPGTVVTATSKVTARGEVWEVLGDPAEWRNPFTGTQAGIEIALRKATG